MNTGAYLSYPISTLSPPIFKNDLSPFKCDGLSRVERETEQKFLALKSEYEKLIEEYEWNRVVYSAEMNFEPLVGQTYHLYEIRDKNVLSLIKPNEWQYKHLGSFNLSFDKHWHIV